MQPRVIEAGGLEVYAILPDPPAETGVVLLHGYAMDAPDLAPFGSSMGLRMPFFFPRAPHATASRGRAWWSIDEETRAASLRNGARDLFELHPAGLESARATLTASLAALVDKFRLSAVILGGFSQGGMLACDVLLRGEPPPVAGLILMSSSCIALQEWTPHQHRFRNLPIFVSHGRNDPDLAFEAGERLRDFTSNGNAQVTWTAFDGGHEIPLPVWRALRRFLRPFA